MTTFGELGGGIGGDPEGVMHARLTTTAGHVLMASGTSRPAVLPRRAPGATVSPFGDDAEDLRGYFTGLGAGGTVTMPLEKQVWGDEFGQLTDRFGIDWMLNISGV